MTNSCKVKHVFPGGNSTLGFYSFFDNILGQEEANHIFCLKGGPGVGKSSFMKKIGKKMTDLDYDVEYHHCSSDPNSLDALVIPKLKIMFVDGTSPHIVDPKNPGAVDEIINLGQFWNESGIKENKEKIIKTNAENKRIFAKAYQYFKSSKEIYETLEISEKKALDSNEYNRITQQLVNELFSNLNDFNKLGKERHLFGYALTPIGIIEFRDTIICNYKNRISVKDTPGSSSEELMNQVVKEAVKRGLYVECYHSPIKVSKIEDILIPQLSISISVINNYHKGNFEYNKELDLTNILNKDILNELNEEINEDKEIFEMLLYKGMNYVNKAKSNHDILEQYYIPNMNFDAIENLINETIERILKYS
ncbi:MAG: ATPase [Haloplasmataceae bacterium]|jgi:hypothetical protein|nr:ATPase [Haloplasmataceae bacterium]